MKIIVNMKLLHEQTNLCDKYMMNAIDDHERNLFEGISNLLDAIGYALIYDKEIEFEKVEGEEE